MDAFPGCSELGSPQGAQSCALNEDPGLCCVQRQGMFWKLWQTLAVVAYGRSTTTLFLPERSLLMQG